MLIVLTTEWLLWLQTNWRDSSRALMLKTNCIRQPQSYFPVHLATTIHALNSLITAVLPSPGYNFLTATLKCICNDSFIDVLRVVSVLWL